MSEHAAAMNGADAARSPRFNLIFSAISVNCFPFILIFLARLRGLISLYGRLILLGGKKKKKTTSNSYVVNIIWT